MKVLNIRTSSNVRKAVLIDRGTKWGNPFIMKNSSEAERKYVCRMFGKYAKWRLKHEPNWLDPLKGKDLLCWCKPKQCHGDTLLKMANDL